MPENRVRVGTVMTWTGEGASSALLQIRVAEAEDQRLLDETLVADGVRVEEGPTRTDGARPVRVHAEDHRGVAPTDEPGAAGARGHQAPFLRSCSSSRASNSAFTASRCVSIGIVSSWA